MKDNLVKILENLHKYPLIVEEIHKFIDEKDRTLSSFKTKSLMHYYFKCRARDFKALAASLSTDEVPASDIISYFRLDSKIFPKIARESYNVGVFSDVPYCSLPNCSYFDGDSLKFFLANRPEGLEALSYVDLNLFPPSSKKIIEKAVKSYNLTKDASLVQNSFSLKAFEHKLPKKPNSKFIQSYFDKIMKEKNEPKLCLLLLNFYNVLHTKYKDINKTKVYSKLLLNIENELINSFSFCNCWEDRCNEEERAPMRDVIEKSDFLINALINLVIKRNHLIDKRNYINKFFASVKNFNKVSFEELQMLFPEDNLNIYKFNQVVEFVNELKDRDKAVAYYLT